MGILMLNLLSEGSFSQTSQSPLPSGLFNRLTLVLAVTEEPLSLGEPAGTLLSFDEVTSHSTLYHHQVGLFLIATIATFQPQHRKQLWKC